MQIVLPGAHEGAPPEPLVGFGCRGGVCPPGRSQEPTVKHFYKSSCQQWALSKPIHVPSSFCSRSCSGTPGLSNQHDGSRHGGDHIANPSFLQNACMLRSVFCSESGCLGFQIKCSCWESQPANPHARKWSHLMSRGEAIGGWVSPEQLEICFLNKSSMVWSLWAAWVESLLSATISSAFILFSGSSGGNKCRICYVEVWFCRLLSF